MSSEPCSSRFVPNVARAGCLCAVLLLCGAPVDAQAPAAHVSHDHARAKQTATAPAPVAHGGDDCAPAGDTAAHEMRYEGEYGLWVSSTRDSVVVHWLTAEAGAGRLEVEAPGHGTLAMTTKPSQAHRAAFRRERRDPLVLRFGLDGQPLHSTTVSLNTPRRPPVSVSRVDSLYIVGDTHGDFQSVLAGLRHAGLIDAADRWTGGRRHLVFAGDMTDRGPDVIRLLWFVYRLEREAAAAGGRVHVVLGNHEIMVLLGDLRYVHPKETAVAAMHGVSYNRMFDTRESVLGRWLVSKPALLRIDGVLIAHGGITPEYANLTLDRFDAVLAQFTSEDLFHEWADTTVPVRMPPAEFQLRDDFFWSPRSVFWHREYVQSDTAQGQLTRSLQLLGARMLVIGHTAVPTIQARYDGRVIAAHTPSMGAELLLLVREGRAHRRYRIRAGEQAAPF